MDRRDRREDVEDLLALQEERPQLGVEERKPLVHVDLRQVRLDLREVRVDREVGGQVGRDAVLQVESGFGDVVLDEGPRGVERSGAEGGDGRQDLQIAARREVGQSFEHPHLRQELRDAARDGRPDDRLVLALDRARDLKPPAVRLALVDRRVPQALERNRQLRRPAVFGRRPGRDEECVPGDVPFRNAAGGRLRRASALRAEGPPLGPVAQAGRVDDGVSLHAEAVHRELIGALPVTERVEEEGDGVVLRNLIPVRAVGAHETRLCVAHPDSDVEVLAVVDDGHRGRLGRGGPLDRRRLHEGREPRGPTPRVVSQLPVDGRRLRDPDRRRDRLRGRVRGGARHGQRGRTGRNATGPQRAHSGREPCGAARSPPADPVQVVTGETLSMRPVIVPSVSSRRSRRLLRS